MLGLTAAALVVLAVITWRIGGNALFPPVLFNGIWALTLLCIFFAGSHFLPISEYACLIYLTGAFVFSFGSMIILCASPVGDPVMHSAFRSAKITRVALDVLLIGLIALFPLYLKVALEIAGTSNIMRAIPAIRLRTVESPNVNLFGLAGNLNVLAILVASAHVLESDGTWGRRIRAIVAVILTLAYGALTGSKAGALFLLTALFVAQVRARRMKLTNALAVVGLALAFFAGGIMVVNLTGQKFEGVGATIGVIGKVVGGYWLGAPIAFSGIVEKPDALVSSSDIDRFALETAQKIGLSVRVPSINNEKYTPISGDGENTNTYTIYFSYFKDYGWGGMILFVAGLSVILTLLWRRAMAGEPVSMLIYASLCTSMLQSVEAEEFFVGLEGYLKAFAVFWILYRFLPNIVEPLWAAGRAGLTHSNVRPT